VLIVLVPVLVELVVEARSNSADVEDERRVMMRMAERGRMKRCNRNAKDDMIDFFVLTVIDDDWKGRDDSRRCRVAGFDLSIDF